MSSRVLVIEDEEPLRTALVDALKAGGFETIEAADGEAGLALALAQAPDVILLDLMLPRLDGYSVLKAMRKDRLTSPVIILSARGEEWDRIQAFEYGADDYVVKPFSSRELVLRLEAVLQRSRGATPGITHPEEKVRVGDRIVDFGGYCLEHEGKRIGLSRKELDLLQYFLAHEGEVLERNQILNDVWGASEFPTTRTIDSHVAKLRKKIEPEPGNPVHIVTVHAVGYRFQRG